MPNALFPHQNDIDATFHQIIEHCQLEQETENRYRGSCPAHDSKSGNGFVVTLTPERILLHCHGECSYEEMVAALGYKLSDMHVQGHNLESDVKSTPRPKPPQPRVMSENGKTATDFDYKNENGKVGYRIRRTDFEDKRPKEIRPYTQIDGRWIQGLDEKFRRYPYNLRCLLDAIKRGEIIFFPEGEQKTQRLIDAGVNATCIAGGAKAWSKYRYDYIHYFQGARVVLLPDHDESGYKFVEAVCIDLKTVCKDVVILPLPGLQKPKEDLIEWLDVYGHTIDELVELAEKALGQAKAKKERAVVVNLADIQERSVDWCWYPYLARGILTFINGDPDVGKSIFTTQLAASKSRGYPLPDQQGQMTIRQTPGRILFLVAEDSLSFTVKPRIRLADGDVSMVDVLTGFIDENEEERSFTLQHMDILEEAIERHQPEIVIIDPITAYLGKVDMYRANETKPLMTALSRAAERYNIAIICLRHLAKASGGGKAIYRGLGSIDFSASARTELFIEAHPLDPLKSLIAHTKNNLGPKGRTQIFSKADGVFQWADVSRIPGDVIGGGGKGPDPMALIEAALWLEAELKNGIPMLSKDIESMAREEGIKIDTLKRAKKLIGVRSTKRGDSWDFALPSLEILQQPPLCTTATSLSSTTSTTTATSDSSIDLTACAPGKEEAVIDQVAEEAEEAEEAEVSMSLVSKNHYQNGRKIENDLDVLFVVESETEAQHWARQRD